jgi:hypothetical protein
MVDPLRREMSKNWKMPPDKRKLVLTIGRPFLIPRGRKMCLPLKTQGDFLSRHMPWVNMKVQKRNNVSFYPLAHNF